MILPGLWKIVARRVHKSLHENDPSRAWKTASLYARLRPRDPQAWLVWQKVPADSFQYDKEEAILREGISRVRDPKELLRSLSEVLISQSKLEEATEIIEELRRQHLDWSWPYILSAKVAVLRRDFASAADLTEQASQKVSATDDPDAVLWLASVLLSIPGQASRAASFLQRVTKAASNDPRAPLMLAILLDDRDAVRAAEFRDIARKRWRGDDVSFGNELKLYDSLLVRPTDAQS